jgi:hypothetical protein
MDSSKNVIQTIREYSIPYYRHTYHTKLSALEIRERLLKHVDTKEQPLFSKIFSARSSKKGSYQGKIEGDTFKIHRVKKGKNSNRPVILGVISPSVNTTQVYVVMRLPYFSALSIVIWIGFLVYFGLGDGTMLGFTDANIYFLLFMVCFGYLVTTISFNYEASKTKNFLKQMLQPVSKNNESDWIIRS